MVTAKECLQSAEVCLALAHKTKQLGTRAALLEFAYEFRTVAKRLDCDERKLMVRAASPIHGECASRYALRRETRSIPIVFANNADPVGSGIVPTLAKPDGNVTGFTALEYAIVGKWLEVLKEIAPGIERVA